MIIIQSKILQITVVMLITAFACILSGFPVLADGSVDTISIGYQPSTHQMAFMTAYEKGWYNESLNPKGVKNIEVYNFPTGAPEMQAMLAGDLDFAYVGSAPFVTAVSNGLDAKIIASANTQGSDLVVRKEISYEKPEDLKGKTIGTFPAGTIQDTILRNWLKKNNIDPEKDVVIKAMGPGDATTAILAGKIDAVFLPHPSPVTIEEEGAGKIVVHSGDMEPGHSCCVLVASGDIIRNHPEIVEEILKTHIKATDYNEKNPEEAAEYMQVLTGLKKDTILKSLKEWDGSYKVDPTEITRSVSDFTEEQEELGYLKSAINETQLFDSSFWKKIAQ